MYGERGRLRVSCYRFDGWEQTNGHAGSPRERLRDGARLLRQLPAALLRARRGGDVMDSYAAEWEQFASAVRHGHADAGATLEDGRRALAVALAAARSAETGRAVKVNEKAEVRGERLEGS